MKRFIAPLIGFTLTTIVATMFVKGYRAEKQSQQDKKYNTIQ